MKLMQLGILLFWTIFWFFNALDKVLNKPMFLWVGKDRVAQFEKYFSSIGIEEPSIVIGFLVLVAVAEAAAFLLLAKAFWLLIKKKEKEAARFFLYGTLMGLAIFTFFAIGDQIFGDRAELLEHSIFWIIILVSWGAYTYYPKLSSRTKS
jgi:hypothetical protein